MTAGGESDTVKKQQLLGDELSAVWDRVVVSAVLVEGLVDLLRDVGDRGDPSHADFVQALDPSDAIGELIEALEQ